MAQKNIIIISLGKYKYIIIFQFYKNQVPNNEKCYCKANIH